MDMTPKRSVERLALRRMVLVAAMIMIMAFSAGVALANNSFPLTTADKISGMKHGEGVMLKGYVKPLGENRYTLTDDSGSVTVLMTEIQWQAAKATSEDLVELYGRASREGEDMVFKVRRANKAK